MSIRNTLPRDQYSGPGGGLYTGPGGGMYTGPGGGAFTGPGGGMFTGPAITHIAAIYPLGLYLLSILRHTESRI